MNRKGLVIGIIILFLVGSFASGITINQKESVQQSSRGILYVGGNGTGNYTKIQDAIDNASDNDTVFVYNGTYYENVVINKDGIQLLGEDKYSTIIDSSGAGDAVYIYNQDELLISGFTIRNAGGNGINMHGYAYAPYTIWCNVNNTISDCIICDNAVNGIYIHPTGKCCRIKFITISNCMVFNNSANGIFFHVDGNHCGILSLENIISNSTIYNNLGDGIKLLAVYHHSGVQGVTVTNCSIINNIGYGMNIVNSPDCSNSQHVIYHNNFIDNTQNAYDYYSNSWYNQMLLEGNYYEDYIGNDNDGDGIGDTPYNISGGSNQDLYPLMYPWYPTHPDTVFVDDDFDDSTPGFGYDRFNRIQYGINEVPENGTVYVFNGTYYEHIIVNKPLTVKGIKNGLENPTTDGEDWGHGFLLMNDNIRIEGFNITNVHVGIGIDSGNNNSLIGNNIINLHWYNGMKGIRLDSSSDNIISNNYIYTNRPGIEVFFSSSNNIIKNNVITDVQRGIQLDFFSNNNILINNTISNADSLIRIHLCNNSIIYNNNFIDVNGALVLDTCSNSLIYHNNFINCNKPEDWFINNNSWDNGYPSGGNYWDDYSGVDYNHGQEQNITGHDRIGDTPYEIHGEGNQDNYPVMHPYGWLNEAPENLTIDGPTTGKVGQSYTYTTIAEDPEVDPIFYMFDWGDDSVSDWGGPYPSGETGAESHIWEEVGDYEIRVKAKDTRGLESDWSDPLVVTMPRDKSINSLFLRFLEKYPFIYQLLQMLLQ